MVAVVAMNSLHKVVLRNSCQVSKFFLWHSFFILHRFCARICSVTTFASVGIRYSSFGIIFESTSDGT